MLPRLFEVVLAAVFGSRTEKFAGRVCHGNECPTDAGAAGMCHTLAAGNCRIPTHMLNDCWLGEYRKCSNECIGSPPDAARCDCYARATQRCGSCDDPALACYQSVHQKCMAGMGFAPDPDR